jgi:ABC-2 type transport system permease protein
MPSTLHAELLKLRTTRAPLLVALGLAAFATLGPPLILLLEGPRRTAVLADAAAQLDVLTLAPVTLFATVLGALVATSDHRHGTVVATLLVTPDRRRVLLAKAVVTAAAAVAVAVVTLVVLALSTAVLLATQGGAWQVPLGLLPLHALRASLPVIAMALVGLGVGELVRSQTVAVAGPLVVSTVLTPMLSALAPQVSWYLPAGLDAVLQYGGPAAPFGRMMAALLLVTYAVAFVGSAAVLVPRRDLA